MTIGYPSAGPAAESASFLAWEGEPPRDEFFWMCQVNKASLVMNTEEGLLPQEIARKTAAGMERAIRQANRPGSPRPKMYIRFEPLIIKEAGIESTLLHVGRSSQDIHSTFQRAMMREAFISFMNAALDARSALLERAAEWRDAPIPCYTNGVAAQPGTLGHVWFGHAQAFERDFRAMLFAWKELNQSPLGTTVLNGTSWPLNRLRTAELLGFSGVIENAFDAGQIATEDFFVGTAQALVLPMLHIGHFIQDLMVQYAQPRPWFLITSTYASSAMPQKRNPGPLVDIRRDASQVLCEAQGAMMRVHNLAPGMYDGKDVRIGMANLQEAADVMDRFAKIFPLLRFDAARAFEELNSDWTASQELADILMRRFAIPFRIGHRFASALVSFARAESFTPLTLPYSDAARIWRELVQSERSEDPNLPESLPLDECGFAEALNPLSIIAARKSFGGPQKDDMDRQQAERFAQLDADRQALREIQAGLTEAEERLEAAYQNVLNGMTESR